MADILPPNYTLRQQLATLEAKYKQACAERDTLREEIERENYRNRPTEWAYQQLCKANDEKWDRLRLTEMHTKHLREQLLRVEAERDAAVCRAAAWKERARIFRDTVKNTENMWAAQVEEFTAMGATEWCDECNAPQWVVGDGLHRCATISTLQTRLALCEMIVESGVAWSVAIDNLGKTGNARREDEVLGKAERLLLERVNTYRKYQTQEPT